MDGYDRTQYKMHEGGIIAFIVAAYRRGFVSTVNGSGTERILVSDGTEIYAFSSLESVSLKERCLPRGDDSTTWREGVGERKLGWITRKIRKERWREEKRRDKKEV